MKILCYTSPLFSRWENSTFAPCEITDVKWLDSEVWKPHPIHSQYYASNYGRIKCTLKNKEKILFQYYGKQGELKCNNKKIGYVTKFIYECFYGLTDKKIIHKDGYSKNNCIDNLEKDKQNAT